jgi:hypothetical protein
VLALPDPQKTAQESHPCQLVHHHLHQHSQLPHSYFDYQQPLLLLQLLVSFL